MNALALMFLSLYNKIKIDPATVESRSTKPRIPMVLTDVRRTLALMEGASRCLYTRGQQRTSQTEGCATFPLTIDVRSL